MRARVTSRSRFERGGLGLISVTDDGCGMTREDAILSLRRHATSKIRRASDLIAIRTLGFRGEALASIASVAKMKLQTRQRGRRAWRRGHAEAGDIEEERACGMAAGTRIEVRELFFNTPARLKFMKTMATEQGAIAEVVQRARTGESCDRDSASPPTDADCFRFPARQLGAGTSPAGLRSASSRPRCCNSRSSAMDSASEGWPQ